MSLGPWQDGSNITSGISENIFVDDNQEKHSSFDCCNGQNICTNAEEIQRKSVICSITDIQPNEIKSDEEESSYAGSLVLDQESDTNEDRGPSYGARLSDFELSPDPNEVECVLTDIGEDESENEKDPLDDSHDIGSGQLSCFLCPFVTREDNSTAGLAKHLQITHKFLIHKSDNVLFASEAECPASDDNQEGSSEGFPCCGCEAVFFSKKALLSHYGRAKNSANSSCWMAAHKSRRPYLCCPKCPYQTQSQKGILDHLESSHGCLKNVHEDMNTFSFQCHFCKAPFWTVAERSEHEVLEHSNHAADFMIKCHMCMAEFSSKVCLKLHFEQEHAGEEQYSGLGFRCRTCFLTFPKFTLIQEHFHLLHRSLLVFHCPKCGLPLKTKKTYQSHLQNTECGTRQECSECKKVLRSKRALSLHYRMKHFNASDISYVCQICKIQFDSKLERNQHYVTNHNGDGPFKCPVCNKCFASKSGMYGHRQTHSKTAVSKCGVCGKEFIRRDSYYEHLLIHNGPRHKCSICGKDFVQRSNLVRHIRIHTGEKPYKCSHCDKSFSDKGACNSHIRVHTRAEACSCPYCGQVFSKKQKLKYHMRKHTGEDLVHCEVCSKTFTTSHSLKEHRLIHDHRIQIMCSYCGKAFASSKYLQRHVSMSHEAVVMYKCPVCNKGFPQQARLKTHLMTHSTVKHLRCLLCSKAYASNRSLRRHLLSDHGITAEHPDFKQCFYVMTPEEAGVHFGAIQAVRKQPQQKPKVNLGDQATTKQLLLRPKPEPFSTDSDTEDNEPLSECEDDITDDVPDLAHQETVTAGPLNSSSCPIKTKAARKQLPFSVVLNDKKVIRSRRGGHQSSLRAALNPSRNIGTEGEHSCPKGK